MRLILSSLAVAVCIASSGCTSAEQSTPDVSTWVLPVWEVGDWWEYEGPDLYERFEVVGRDQVNDEEAYKLDYEGEDTGDVETGTFWISTVDLGTLRYQSDARLSIDEDCPGIFPLENHTGACRVEVNGSPVGQSTRRVLFGPMEVIATPAGELHAVNYWYDDGDGGHIFSGWYSDEVGFWAQKEADAGRVAKIVDWSYTAN